MNLSLSDVNIISVITRSRNRLPAQHMIDRAIELQASSDAMKVIMVVLGLETSDSNQVSALAEQFVSWADQL